MNNVMHCSAATGIMIPAIGTITACTTMIRHSMKLALVLCCTLVIVVQAYAEQMCKPDSIASTAPLKRFEIAKEVAIDSETGLMWRRCFEGRVGSACDQGSLLEMSWPKALQYIEKINHAGTYVGYRNWRMPSVKELLSLVELQCVKPSLNTKVFPSAPSVRIWSSTPYRFYPHYSWFVDTTDMITNHVERFKPYALVLVRDAPQ